MTSAMLVAGACGSSGENSNGGDGDSCQTGSIDCECYENSTCNTDLTCTGGTCIDPAGTGGSPGGGTGGQPSGGSPGTGGTDGSETGGNGSGGDQTCGDTSSDWQNCGECGRMCDNEGDKCGEGSSPAIACCETGQCAPYWGPCFEQEDFSTCDEACTSIGETCVADGCSSGTFLRTTLGWLPNAADSCESVTNPHTGNNWACDAILNWKAGVTLQRCCCTDTQ